MYVLCQTPCSRNILTSRSTALLFFDHPHGLRLHVSSLASPNFASSYEFGSVGLVNGSLSYLYSSIALPLDASSETLNLRAAVPGYRQVADLRRPEKPWAWETWQQGLRIDRKETLLYGRMYLPGSRLEGLYLRRLSPLQQLKIACVSDSSLPNGGSLLALLQSDSGKYNMDYLFSTDSAMLGIRGLYNFGPDPRVEDVSGTEGPNGRFSAGAELYYGARNKSGGMSTGLRFTTLPRHTGMPYTMTLTLNPLMGNVSSTYSVQAGRNLSLCSQYDFNFYSYESDLRMGLELWRETPKQDLSWARQKTSGSDSLQWAKRKLLREDSSVTSTDEQAGTSGVLKVRWDRAWGVGLLWEGQLSSLLFSAGVSLDLQRREQIFRAVGAEVRFSSGPER